MECFIFLEDVLSCRSTHKSNSKEEVQKTVIKDSLDWWGNDQEVDEPRHSKRARTKKSFGLDFITFLLKNEP